MTDSPCLQSLYKYIVTIDIVSQPKGRPEGPKTLLILRSGSKLQLSILFDNKPFFLNLKDFIRRLSRVYIASLRFSNFLKNQKIKYKDAQTLAYSFSYRYYIALFLIILSLFSIVRLKQLYNLFSYRINYVNRWLVKNDKLGGFVIERQKQNTIIGFRLYLQGDRRVEISNLNKNLLKNIQILRLVLYMIKFLIK